MIMIKDSIGPFKATIDETTGFLTAPVTLARVGVQHYMGYELGLKDRALDKVGVLRSPEEVFDEGSVNTFVNLVSTNNHPSNLVTTDNVKDLQMGTVSGVSVAPDNKTLKGIVTITDKGLINKIKEGKSEVSVGYTNDLIEEKGVFDGVPYDFKQTKIIANHLAIVSAGRCGPACKITVDHKKEKNMIIKLGGISFDTENTQLAQAIQKQQEQHDAEMKKKNDELDKKDQEIGKEKSEKEKATATADALRKTQLDDAALSVMVNERATLLTDAKMILGDKMPDCNCPKEIRIAVVDSVIPGTKLEDKSDDYIAAMYDMALEKSKGIKKILSDAGNGIVDGAKTTEDSKTTRDGARAKYMKDQLNLEAK